MKKIIFIIFINFCFNRAFAQDCNPQIHVDALKKHQSGGYVKKEFLLNFKKDSIVEHTIELKANRGYTISFGTKNKGNQGIILTIFRNGSRIKRGFYEAEADVQFPFHWNVRRSANYTIRFTYRKDYIQDYCAGAILVEY